MWYKIYNKSAYYNDLVALPIGLHECCYHCLESVCRELTLAVSSVATLKHTCTYTHSTCLNLVNYTDSQIVVGRYMKSVVITLLLAMISSIISLRDLRSPSP
jgi:hypothetical protein